MSAVQSAIRESTDAAIIKAAPACLLREEDAGAANPRARRGSSRNFATGPARGCASDLMRSALEVKGDQAPPEKIHTAKCEELAVIDRSQSKSKKCGLTFQV